MLISSILGSKIHKAILGALIAGASFTFSTAHAGGLDAGGGYAIRCDDGKLYAWDYVNAPFSGMKIRDSYLHAKSAKEIIGAIADRLLQRDIEMSESLRKFAKFNEDPIDTTQDQIWEMNTNPLLSLGDQDLMRIPVSCVANAGPGFKLYQAVVRYEVGSSYLNSKVHFAADVNILKQLEQNNPLQLSFLYIHEWLRTYTHDAHALSMANQILHADTWPASEGEFSKVMSQVGISSWVGGVYSGSYEFEDRTDLRHAHHEARDLYYSPSDNFISQLEITRNDDGSINVTGKTNDITFNSADLIDPVEGSRYLPVKKTVVVPGRLFAFSHLPKTGDTLHRYLADFGKFSFQYIDQDNKRKIVTVVMPVKFSINPFDSYAEGKKGTACIRAELSEGGNIANFNFRETAGTYCHVTQPTP
jgi:hypothetical protein